MKSINKKDFIVAGTVAKTHGTKGELKLITDIPVKFSGWAFLEIREKPVPFIIDAASKTAHNEWILKLNGIDTVEAAKAFTNLNVLVVKPKGKRKPTDSGFDLSGFTLIDRQIGEIGAIVATEELPQQTMLVSHYKGNQVMIPMVEAFIDDVDDEKEIIYLNLPEGFFDLYE